ncbi:MAG TPA: ScyD/ScyE family protein [Steroidobacter sp.]
MNIPVIRTFARAISGVAIVAGGLLSNLDAAATDSCKTIADGLRAPIGSALTEQSNLLVSETGIVNVPASGRISIVSPEGKRRTLLDGLPQGTNAAGGDASGPNALSIRGRTIYVAIGQGDTVIPGPIAGSAVPNPDVSSPIFSSILAIHLSAAVERKTEGFVLSEQNQATLAGGGRVVLSNGGGDRITIEAIVDFPDYESEPLPTVPGNVRNSNPFDVIAVANNLYVTNGGLNRVVKVDLSSGAYAELASFARIQNLPGAAGPPSVEPVPTGIAYSRGSLLVSLFSGAPFLPGVSRIKSIDPVTGDQSDFITGLRTAIDIQPVRKSGDTDYLVLENNFAPVPAFPPTGASIKLFETPGSAASVIGDCALERPTSISLDKKSGLLYVTELLRGTVLRTRVNLE